MLANGLSLRSRNSRNAGLPNSLPNNAAWYDVSDVTSLRNNAGNIPSNGDGIKLIADKSGNSNTNCLCLNGVAGNYASMPDSADFNVTTLDVDLLMRQPDWSPASSYTILAKRGASGQRSWNFGLDSGGTLSFTYSADGTANTTLSSSAAVPFADFDLGYVRALWVGNDGGVASVTFFTSTDGTTWSQLGTKQLAGSAGSLFDSTALLEIGSFASGTGNPSVGNFHRVRIYSGNRSSGGTLLRDVNFSLASKLATSFTESSSNAATVTINTSGDLGARIAGERDLYQGTAANQPVLTIASSGNYLTFDGTNDYMKAPAFSLSQPETVYFVGSQVSWTAGEKWYAGNANDTRLLVANTSTPQVALYAGTGNVALVSATLGTNFVVSSVFNGASSSNRLNRAAAATGNPGTVASNGFTLASNADGGAASCANITFREAAIYAAAHDTATQDNVIVGMGARRGISV